VLKIWYAGSALMAAATLVAALLGKAGSDLVVVVMATVALTLYFALASRRCLVCDDAGLHLGSDVPWPLSVIEPEWRVAWGEIRDVRWVGGLIPAQLVLETRSGTKTLLALQWQADREEARACQRAITTYRVGRSAEFDVSILPLVRVLREHGIEVPDSIGAKHTAAHFDLVKNPASRGAILIAAAASVFWIVDANVTDQMYGRQEPWISVSAFTFAAALMFGIAQWRARVPPVPNAVVTLTVAVSLGLAFYNGLQRLNQLADRDGPREVEFTLQPDGSLRSNVPEVRDLPQGFFGDARFWAAQKPGSVHRFPYYRALGFETLDIGEYRKRVKKASGRDPGRDIFGR
jgi:hypothetical protein